MKFNSYVSLPEGRFTVLKAWRLDSTPISMVFKIKGTMRLRLVEFFEGIPTCSVRHSETHYPEFFANIPNISQIYPQYIPNTSPWIPLFYTFFPFESRAFFQSTWSRPGLHQEANGPESLKPCRVAKIARAASNTLFLMTAQRWTRSAARRSCDF